MLIFTSTSLTLSFSIFHTRVFLEKEKAMIKSYDGLIGKYKGAKTNLDTLTSLGARLLHGVDATTMERHVDLRMQKFDRIVYNFSHAGFFGKKEDDESVILRHKDLVAGFFRNASRMLEPNGEVHVSHKTTPPFTSWNIAELASESGLKLRECVEFNPEDYPGYRNKRGDGRKSDKPFPLRECSTFKFTFKQIRDVLIGKYKGAKTNLDTLTSLGARLIHGVDATTMELHADLHMKTFDRIVYNFPHAGFFGKHESEESVILRHKDLVAGFFRNASRMLEPAGEVHVSHKTTPPFTSWNISHNLPPRVV